MVKAIVYTSYTGNTAAYAKLLGEQVHLPVFSLAQAKKAVSPGTVIIYLGWLMAGGVKGYRVAAKRYHVCAVCAVGMGRTGTQMKEVRQKNTISDDVALFTLQGGFDRRKLHGVYRFMMNMMAKTVGKMLSEKQNRNSDEDEMLDLMLNGGSMVCTENLSGILEWCGTVLQQNS